MCYAETNYYYHRICVTISTHRMNNKNRLVFYPNKCNNEYFMIVLYCIKV